MTIREALLRARRRPHHFGAGSPTIFRGDGYEFVDRIVPIKDLRFCITHANFPSKQNLERCKELGVCADVQPAWLYKDGATLAKVLGAAAQCEQHRDHHQSSHGNRDE